MRWRGYRDKLEAVKSQVGSDGSPSAPALDSVLRRDGWSHQHLCIWESRRHWPFLKLETSWASFRTLSLFLSDPQLLTRLQMPTCLLWLPVSKHRVVQAQTLSPFPCLPVPFALVQLCVLQWTSSHHSLWERHPLELGPVQPAQPNCA